MDEEPSIALDPYVQNLIRYKAKRLATGHAFSRFDREDIVQELHLRLAQAMPRHNPRRGAVHTFAHRVVHNAAATLVESARAQRRDRRRVHDGLDLDLLPSRNPTPEQIDLRLDLPQVIARLPALDQRVAHALSEVDQAKAARYLGLTRQQLRSARVRISEHLVARGLAEKPQPEQPLCVGTP